MRSKLPDSECPEADEEHRGPCLLESTLFSLIIQLVVQRALDRRVHSGLYLLSSCHDWLWLWLCLLFRSSVAATLKARH